MLQEKMCNHVRILLISKIWSFYQKLVNNVNELHVMVCYF